MASNLHLQSKLDTRNHFKRPNGMHCKPTRALAAKISVRCQARDQHGDIIKQFSQPTQALATTTQGSSVMGTDDQASQPNATPLGRREMIALATTSISLLSVTSLETKPAAAIQGSIAGRIPGITGPDSEGYYLYTRPEGKSGGHGVGWSEMQQYSFRVPKDWSEVPVSIADLGGTEIDLRYGKDDSGSLMVIVAPILRFADIGFNANVKIDELGPPDKIIAGFAPELFGAPLNDDDVLNTQVTKKDGATYYSWELKPHRLVSATADGNRMFIIALSANSRQWRKASDELRTIQQSFYVPPL